MAVSEMLTVFFWLITETCGISLRILPNRARVMCFTVQISLTVAMYSTPAGTASPGSEAIISAFLPCSSRPIMK